jgi:hypothetical protein
MKVKDSLLLAAPAGTGNPKPKPFETFRRSVVPAARPCPGDHKRVRTISYIIKKPRKCDIAYQQKFSTATAILLRKGRRMYSLSGVRESERISL